MNKIVLILSTLMFVFGLNASAFASVQDEINHLLKFISQSHCEFIRNGSRYNSVDASEHIEKKYKYYQSSIDTAEEFIKRAATKSSLSGKEYQVECDGRKQSTAEWLSRELDAYRNKVSG